MKLILYPNLLNAPDCEKKWWAENKWMRETKQQCGTDWYFIHGPSSVSAPQRSHLKMLFATHPSRVVIYAAITAAQIAGSVVGRPCSLADFLRSLRRNPFRRNSARVIQFPG